ncbi:MAG: hypothetical protein JXR83_14665 [Deltaproteobacteria bacterium]|nr:hypothetical protein [Deltaproteobacteria bacterium]
MTSCRSRIAGALALAACALALAVPTAAKKRGAGGVYEDTKGRFALDLPLGWNLAPMPGDLKGMMFRRDIGDVPALFHAAVEGVRDSDTLESALDRLTSEFAQEIGYRKLTDLQVKVAGLPALRRTHSAFLSGNDKIVRYSVDTVLIAYGHVHFLHFETAENAYPSFKGDLDKLLGSFRPLVGRKVYGPLLGDWELVSSRSGLRLSLAADLSFVLGDKRGRYRADGTRLTFIQADGRETFDYAVSESSLVVRNDNLSDPMTYRRVGQQRPDLVAVPPASAAERSIVGAWRVVDGDITLRLSPSGAVQFGPLSGRYRIKGALLTIESAAGVEMTYHYSIHAGRLTLSGGDLEQPLVLQRE